jgi:epoxyqueuosine reductase QueG
MEKITNRVKAMAKSYGAVAVGIATTETLADGPPSTDLTYVLPEGRSAVTFAVPLDQDYMDPWFNKRSHSDHFQNNIRTNVMASGISLEIANYLQQKGFAAVPLASNAAYRQEAPNGRFDEKPPISHRYLAVRSGVGFFGLSGNVLTADNGAGIILGSVVTAAELIATDPIPESEHYCDDCQLCVASCASGFIDGKEKIDVTMGGMRFTYSKKHYHNRCDYVCGGFTGLHKSGRWSTWSPGRFPIPDSDEDFQAALLNAVGPYLNRPKKGSFVFNALMPGDRVELTCGNCQLICHPDKTVRKARYKMLVESGVIVEHPDGTREAVSVEEAKEHLACMPPEQKALYE